MSPKKSKASEVSFAHVHILLKRFHLWSFSNHVKKCWPEASWMMFRRHVSHKNGRIESWWCSERQKNTCDHFNPQTKYIIHMGVEPKIRGTPKWMVYNWQNPIKMGWFGGKTHHFRKPPNILSAFVKLLKTIKQRQGVFWIVTTFIYTTLQGWFFEPKQPAFPLINESHVSVPAPTYFESLKDVAVQPTVG